jgi:DNA-binding MurR/RpiR family transcriptional regulator
MPSIHERVEQTAATTTPSLGRVGRWMAAHPIQTLSHSADEIASQTGTSVAAVNRFSRAAGFRSFSDLKSAWGAELQSVMDPVRKLVAGRSSKNASRAETQGIDLAAIERALERAPVERAAGRLLKARQVWVLGLGMSSHVAAYAADALEPYLRVVRPLAGTGGTEQVLRHLLHCGRGDVLLVISLPRYSRDIIRLANFARQRGAHAMAITDSAAAPLAQIAQTLLLAPAEHPWLPSSTVGAVALVEALAGAVMRLNPDAQRVASDLSEAVLAHLETHTPQTHTPETHTPETHTPKSNRPPKEKT